MRPSPSTLHRYPPLPYLRLRRLRNLLILLITCTILYESYPPFRHSLLALVRCARLMEAVILNVWDYKQTFAFEDSLTPLDSLTADQRSVRRQRRRECHLRSSKRMLEALKKNSGIYVKLGQHVAAVQVLPPEWTSTMTPLQDQCFPTPIPDVDLMLKKDLGKGIEDLFYEFDPNPIGVASLAQVHRAIDKRSGRRVAVKLQHSDLEEFAKVDMATVNFAINLVRYVFPNFEFSWLGEEMNQMLPLEMDFRQEAINATRTIENFSEFKGKTSLYIPEVLWAERRVLVMEYIDGKRVDDLAYLKQHKIDRNQVSQELSRIFSKMVYIDGFFHADPHHGNLLVRPKAKNSSSPFNFDVVLLDHGQYFDIPDELRVNYARFWLSLLKRSSEETSKERRKYARLVGNIDDEMYPVLESAITGRLNLSDPTTPDPSSRPSSLLDERSMDDKEIAKLRNAMMEREGLIMEIFELLRTVPRRLLMILKLSDLQRSLDQSLSTTHGQSRIFLIIAQYCAQAIYQSDLSLIRTSYNTNGLSFSLLEKYVSTIGSYMYWKTTFGLAEWLMDVRARWVKVGLWVHGLTRGGFRGAGLEMAGLSVV
ncbi:Atypical/ABC1/ABC1-B protein kinase [Tremella mesenterica]|uniref:Atypical/ABC1/ABC1-B protein kinase n=1 Tax=Tremella mesenterica TaxID=5217 RepID=A0A4Q1BMX1_TREME|nr:Atypical/ABC1/ABC1-B protein kinase [Tremella mesenterica]